MIGENLQRHARDRADELPGAALEHPFGPGWEDFTVRGKVFMLMTDLAGESIVTRPVGPATFARNDR